MTGVPSRRSIPAARCSSAVRATSESPESTSPAIQYGIPQAEYDVCLPLSSTVIASSRPRAAAVRSAW